jgi:Integrase core domain
MALFPFRSRQPGCAQTPECDRRNLSMSGLGNCCDYAKAEAFFSTLKSECLPPDRFFESKAVARRELFEYIETYTITNAFTVRWVIKPLGNSRRSISKKETTFSKKILRRLLLRSETKFKRANGINGRVPRASWEAVRLCRDCDLERTEVFEPFLMNRD